MENNKKRPTSLVCVCMYIFEHPISLSFALRPHQRFRNPCLLLLSSSSSVAIQNPLYFFGMHQHSSCSCTLLYIYTYTYISLNSLLDDDVTLSISSIFFCSATSSPVFFLFLFFYHFSLSLRIGTNSELSVRFSFSFVCIKFFRSSVCCKRFTSLSLSLVAFKRLLWSCVREYAPFVN